MARVCVLVPTFNRAAYLGETLASVLGQDFPDFEVVVADNASTDETPAIVAGFSDDRICYVRRAENRGWRDNFRLALRDVDSEYVTIVCDDDRLLPGALTRAVGVLDEHPPVGLVHSTFHLIDAESRSSSVIGNWTGRPAENCIEDGHDFIVRSISSVNRVCASTAVMRVAALPATYYEAEDDFCGDFALYIQIALHWAVGFLATPGAELRLHPDQVSASLDPVDAALTLEAVKLRFLDAHADQLAPIAPLCRAARHATQPPIAGAVSIAADSSRARGARLLGHALRLRPMLLTTPAVWRACAKLALGPRLLSAIRRREDSSGVLADTLDASDLP